jgi:hypothetical protein
MVLAKYIEGDDILVLGTPPVASGSFQTGDGVQILFDVFVLLKLGSMP